MLLTNGSYLFVGAKYRLTVKPAGDGEELCIYDTPIVCFSLSPSLTKIAILSREVSPAAESSATRRNGRGSRDREVTKYVVKIFGFDAAEAEVQSLIASASLSEAFKAFVWSSREDYIVAENFATGAVSILKIASTMSANPNANLSVVADDSAYSPFFFDVSPSRELCALFSVRQQALQLWDLDENSIATSLTLTRREVRVLDVAKLRGNFIVTLYDDYSITFAVWDSDKFVKQQKIEDLFPEEADNDKVQKISSRLLCNAVGDTAVVALTSSRHVYKFQCDANAVVLTGHCVVGLGEPMIALTPTEYFVDVGRQGCRKAVLPTFEAMSEKKKEKKKPKAADSLERDLSTEQPAGELVTTDAADAVAKQGNDEVVTKNEGSTTITPESEVKAECELTAALEGITPEPAAVVKTEVSVEAAAAKVEVSDEVTVEASSDDESSSPASTTDASGEEREETSEAVEAPKSPRVSPAKDVCGGAVGHDEVEQPVPSGRWNAQRVVVLTVVAIAAVVGLKYLLGGSNKPPTPTRPTTKTSPPGQLRKRQF